MGHARGPEVVDLRRRLLAIVAQDHPGEKGATIGIQCLGPLYEGSPELIGEAAHRAARTPVGCRFHEQPCSDVAALEIRSPPLGERGQPATDLHRLAGQARRQH